MKRIVFAGAAIALLALAGCAQTPEARINAACVRDGGLMPAQDGQPKPAAAEIKRQCDCFTKNVKETMTPEELKTLADLMNQPKKKEGEAGSDKMPPAIATKMMGAMKACVIPS